MKKRSSEKNPLGGISSQALMVWGAVLALTALRLSVATSGKMTGTEALITVCGAHPAGGYIEGSAGAPLLLTLLQFLGISSFTVLRWISPLALLPVSWAVWWIGRRVAPHRPAVALWSVLAVNLLPSVTLASLVMNGSMVTASLILLSVVAGWQAAEAQGEKTLRCWMLVGILLALTTLFWLPAWCLIIGVLALRFVKHGMRAMPWRGMIAALGMLSLGWLAPVGWNARHDWIQWHSVATGFDSIALGRISMPLGVLVALCAFATPFLVRLAWISRGGAVCLVLIALISVSASGLAMLFPSMIPEGLPSPLGIGGVNRLSEAIMKLREERPDQKGEAPFLIAASPELAALLGSRIDVAYPDRPGAPSVFSVESPSMNSSYALWPSYADAVAAGVADNLYTEEKSASPFLGRNALYVTTEASGELPQTITGAFGAVALLKELPMTRNGKVETVRIYQCEAYHPLSL